MSSSFAGQIKKLNTMQYDPKVEHVQNELWYQSQQSNIKERIINWNLSVGSAALDERENR